jgi:transposase InsO family protein
MYGLPDILHVDHGSDFTSHHLERTATELHIRIIHSAIGRPQAEERSNGSSVPSTPKFSPPSPGAWHRGTGNQSPGSISRDWIAPSEASLPPTTTRPTAKSVDHHGMHGSQTAGFPGCPKA